MNRSSVRRLLRTARRSAWYDSPWRIAGAALSIAVTIALLAVVAALFVIPKVLGGASLTVLTGSMEPVFMPGDVVVVKGVNEADVCTSIGIGTIVTYFPEPGSPDLITHRVVAKTVGTFDDGTHCRLITQGDNNDATDEPVSPAQVRGVFMYGIPQLGWARQWVQQNPRSVAMVVGAIVVVALLWGSLRPPKTRVVSYGATGAAVPSPPAPGPLDEAELQLRRRELAVREREVAVREHELALLRGDPPPPPPPADPPHPILTGAAPGPAATPEQN